MVVVSSCGGFGWVSSTNAGCVGLMVNPLLLGAVNLCWVGQLNGENFIKVATHGSGTVRIIQN